MPLTTLKVGKNELNFRVENSAIKKEHSKSGIGLENIKKRLEMLYPEKHILEISENGELFKVNLKIAIKNEE